MKNDIAKSLIFLTIVRETLLDMIPNKNVDLKNYIVNEASDYEMISILVNGIRPNEKYNSVKEQQIFMSLKEFMVENYKQLSTIVDKDILQTLIFEIGPVSSYGFSSAKPILEYNIKHKKGVNLTELNFSVPSLSIHHKKDDRPLKYESEKEQEDRKKKQDYKDEMNRRAKADEIIKSWKKDKENPKFTNLQKAGLVSAGALASIIALGAYDKYKKYKNNKKEAIKAQLNSLQAGLETCNKSKDPESCKNILKKRIDKLSSKL